MAQFDIFSAQSIAPYNDDALNKVYNLLFCDDISLYKSESLYGTYPFDVLFSDNPDTAKLEAIAIDQKLETRHQLLAYHLLKAKGTPAKQRVLGGVIIEVAMENGLDVLAAFNDGTARYINYTGKLLIWETQTQESNQLITQLFNDSINVVNRIGPWDGDRRQAPVNGAVRLSFLVSGDLYFGEGPFEVLQRDAMGGPVINSATMLMTYLTQYKK